MRQGIAMAGIVAVLLGGVALSGDAGAQQNPNSQQIIDALRPGGNILGGQTRGIRPVTPAAPAQTAPAGAPQAQTAPPQPADGAAPSVNLTVNFATGSAELTPQARRTLDELGRALSSPDLAAFRFRVEGHTDTVGSAPLNQTLSERRAAAVVRYLSAQFGIAGQRLEAAGRGESEPLVPTGDNVNEPRNRRVQVINIGS
ncbi:OmpA family protein [Falsiroseomonas oryzae]|uniref:OmpA family protein n=1 Tax=Falsiroseomonas oryzae TaxID=2766473 RepID=UPI0022EA8FAB|nr:OmpA family protein [Roseomonas sp. MO-31]